MIHRRDAENAENVVGESAFDRHGFGRTFCRFQWILCVLCASAVMMEVGCASTKRSPVQDPGTSPLTAPITNTDACATAMHDICGAFLLFYASQDRLPKQLSELYQSDFLSKDIRFVCPVGQQPYIYNPSGIFLQDQNARVILYDATPAHSQHRWAISIQEPHPGQPLVAKVIALPEQFFLLQR